MKRTLFTAIGLAYISSGMQLVIIAWLAVKSLALSPLAVSAMIAVTMLPQILLLPLSGRLADRYSPAQMAKWACIGLAVGHLVFALLWMSLGSHWLTLAVYAFFCGTCTAIFLPSKDKAAVQMMPGRLQKAVSLNSAFQFLGVLIGSFAAGFVNDIGLSSLLFSQGVLLAMAAFGWHVLAKDRSNLQTLPLAKKNIQQTSYLTLLKNNTALVHLLLLCAFNGFLHMGFAVALFPILGLEFWSFSGVQYGLMQALFFLGGIAVYLANAYRPMQQYPGQSALFCLLYTAAIVYGITRGPTLNGSFGLIFLWGAAAGFSASMSRIVLHSLAKDNERGSIASLYQWVLLLSAFCGSLVAGLVIDGVGVKQSLEIIAIASVVVFCLFLLSRTLWSVQQDTENNIHDQ